MLQFADTFNTYGTNTAFMLNGLYAAVDGQTALVADPDPNVTGKNVLKITANAFNGFRTRRVFSGGRDTAGFGLRIWLSQLPPDNSCIPSFTFLDGSSIQQCAISIDSIGRLIVHTGNGNGAAIGTSAPVITANAYQHIEFKATRSATVGAFEVRVNGATVLTGTGVNTGANQYFQWCIECPNSTGSSLTYYIKDLVVWDSTGTYNKDFMGSVNVIDLLPDADVAFNWTASTGTTGFNRINATPPVDTSYIAAGFPAPAASLFGIQNLPADVTSVRAAVVCVRSEKIDGGDGNMQAALKSGATTGLGTDRPMTVAFTYYQDIFEVDPATSAPWLPAAVNAANLQLNRTV